MDENRFTKLGDILPAVLKAIGLDRKIKENEVLRLWPEVVGEEVASRTKAEKFEKGVLYVQVTHSAWIQELHFMEKRIIRELEAKAPEVNIKRIRLYTAAI
jgi:predicted nucleic acid-binding Zn ribbon protein